MLTGYAGAIVKRETALGNNWRIETAINARRAMPRSIDRKQLKGSTDTYSVRGDYYRIDYRVNSGQVLIYNIQPIDAIQRARDRMEKVALYRVKKRQGVWQVAEKTDRLQTAYAAVNGQSNNLSKAPWLMGAHLEFEFGEGVTEFTLFHNPSIGGAGDTWESSRDRLGLTTDVTR